MKKAILILSAVFCFIHLFAQNRTASKDTLFFDDFNGKTLNRNYWNVEVTGRTVNNEQQAYVDSAATIYFVKGKSAEGAKNGALVLKAVYDSGYTSAEKNKYDFISGRINTRSKFEFNHGTASVRMKMAGSPGLWPRSGCWGTANGLIAVKLI